MCAIHPESQEDATEWHPIFEFQMKKENKSKKEKMKKTI